MIASPPLDREFRDLQNCPTSEISQIRIYNFDSINSGSTPTLVLRADAAARFMDQISMTEKAYPDHPQGGSTIFVEVDTVRWGTRHLHINQTDNCGVLIYISSKRVGDGGSWGAGPWRNDDLAEVFSDFAAAENQRRASK
jgi:hypothetical protein